MYIHDSGATAVPEKLHSSYMDGTPYTSASESLYFNFDGRSEMRTL